MDFADRLDKERGAFQDTAAIMMNLDLVVSSEILRQFIHFGSWFDRRYQRHCDARYPTFKAAVNLWLTMTQKTWSWPRS